MRASRLRLRSVAVCAAVLATFPPRAASAQASLVPADQLPLCGRLVTAVTVPGIPETVWQNAVGAWTVRATDPGALTIETVSDSLDPVLVVFDHSASDTLVASDDDSGEGINARVTLPVSGGESLLLCAFVWTSGIEPLTVRSHLLSSRPSTPRAAARELRLGTAVTDTLRAEDDSTIAGANYHLWRFTTAEPIRAAITVAATDFDPEVELFRSNGGRLQPLGSNDDGPGGLSSMLELPLEAGAYVIAPRAHERGTVGEYTVEVRVAEPPNPLASDTADTDAVVVSSRWSPDPALLIVAQQERDLCERLAARPGTSVPELARRNVVSAWSLLPTRVATVIVETRNANVDPVLAIYSRHSADATALATDDDSAGELNARVVLQAEPGQDRLVCVHTFAAQLSAARVPTAAGYVLPRSTTERVLRPGVPENGDLWFDDDTTSTGRFFQNWHFTLSSPRAVAITMSSRDFDPEIEVFRANAGELESVGSNDDGDEGLDSRLELSLAPGEYVISARAHNRAAIGSYAIAVREGGYAAATAGRNVSSLAGAAPVTLGRPAEGELASTDPLFSDGSHYDFWTFAADSGQRVRIRMFSNAFPPYFSFGQERAGRFAFIEGSNAASEGVELVAEISETERYVVRANSQGSGPKTGSYILLVDPVP